jgi:DNA-directed RNA polymerase alpha subunit
MEAGIETVSEFLSAEEDDLISIKGMGEKSLDNFRDELAQFVDLETGQLLEQGEEAVESDEEPEEAAEEKQTAKLEAQEE